MQPLKTMPYLNLGLGAAPKAQTLIRHLVQHSTILTSLVKKVMDCLIWQVSQSTSLFWSPPLLVNAWDSMLLILLLSNLKITAKNTTPSICTSQHSQMDSYPGHPYPYPSFSSCSSGVSAVVLLHICLEANKDVERRRKFISQSTNDSSSTMLLLTEYNRNLSFFPLDFDFTFKRNVTRSTSRITSV